MPTTENFFARQARKLMRRPTSKPAVNLKATTLEDRVVPSIAGFAFQDYNANGAFDNGTSISNLGGTNKNNVPAGVPGTVNTATDVGFGGLTVRIFDSNGALVDTQTTAAGTGAWISNVPTGTNSYRVEYSGFNTGYNPGPHGATAGTATQFVNNGGTANIGVVRASDYSPNNPILVTQLYTYGSAVGNNNPALISFGYNAGASGTDPGTVGGLDSNLPNVYDLAVPASQVGATWGLAQSRQQQAVYAAAFTKRHVGWGPSGPGAIYRMATPTQTSVITPSVTTASTWINLQGLSASYNGGTLNIDVIGSAFTAWAAARQDPANQNQPFFESDGFNTGWNAVGRTSLGGMAISEDGNFIYVMNLAQKVLIEIPVNADGTANTAGLRAFDMPTITGVPAANAQPFAVEYHNGRVYVGIVNSAESTQNRADLRGFVYQFNPAGAGSFSPTSVVNDGTAVVNNGVATASNNGFRLDYTRGNGYAGSENFLPWSATFATIASVNDGTGLSANSPRAVKYPQAWLTGFSFDNQDNIVLNFRDRVGDQSGSSIPDGGTVGDTLFYEAISAGDILKGFVLSGNSNSWGLERNGASPPGAAFPATAVTTSVTAFGATFTGGPNDGEGPNADPSQAGTGKAGANPGGEFFGSDFFAGSHADTAIGSSVHVPGFPDIVTSNFDPVVAGNVRTSGVRWIRASDGTYVKAYQIYSQDQGGRGAYGSTFGKANGQGDLIAVAEPPPIEIGNRIFQDTNRNGIQDAGEPGISGVIVDLLDSGGNLLGSVTTNGAGEYFFNSGTDPNTANNPANEKYGVSKLVAGGSYTVRIPNASGPNQQSALNNLIATKFNVLTDAFVGDTEQQGRNSNIQVVGATGAMTATMGVFGASNHTFDAGFAPGVSLGDFVWSDANNNGTLDSGEAGINGVAVRLYTDANGDGTPDNATPDFSTVTANDTNGNPGFYLFNGLAPGKYVVEITSPAGYRSSTGNAFDPVNGAFESTLITSKSNSNNDAEDHGYTVSGDLFGGFIIRANTVTLADIGNPANPDSNGNANLRQDFGLYQAYSLGNRVWNDRNNDGLLNNAEVGIDGVSVSLFRPSDFDASGALNVGAVAIATATTSTGGYYRFDNLLAGQYVVAVNGSSAALSNLRSSTGGSAVTTTYEPAASAIPAPGVTDNDDNGTTVGTIVRSGVITLAASSPLNEADLVTPPGGLPAQGTLDAQADMTIDFGFFEPLALGNRVFNDANNSGSLDGTEVGIDGVSVSVFRSDSTGSPIGAAIETQTTKLGGYYLFTNLGADNYVVRVASNTLPAGFWLSSTGKNGNTTGPNEPAPALNTNTADSLDRGSVLDSTTVTSSVISISPNNAPAAAGTPGFTDVPDTADSYRTVDFGFFQPVSLGNLIWNDGNNNGKFDSATEAGLGSVPVNLYADTDGNGSFNAAFDQLIGNTTTNGAGFYLFQNLTPGGYFVEIAPSGFVSSTGTPSSQTGPYEPGITTNTENEDHGTQAGNVIRSGLVTLQPIGGTIANPGGADIGGLTDPTPQAGRNYTIDFGVFQTLSVGNFVWNDLNNNGLFDGATEKGIANVPVRLLDTGNNTLFSTTTDSNGAYIFNNLSAGTYTVQITAPTGFISSTGTPGSAIGNFEPGVNGTQDNQDHGTQGIGSLVNGGQFVLAAAGGNNPDNAGTANLRQDFGLFQPMSLGNFVWADTNNNGIFDGTEAGLAGALVTLTNSGGAVVGTPITTLADGAYLFTNLVPDTYTVTVTPPANYISSTGANGKSIGNYEPGVSGTQNNEDHGTQSGSNAVTSVTLAAPGDAANPDNTGLANLRQDFGFFQPLSLGNFIFNDINNDGLFGGADTKLNGVTVTLLTSAGVTVNTTSTDTNGNYLFTNLTPGSYIVRVTPPSGFVSSSGKNGSLTGPYEPGLSDTTDNADHGTTNGVTIDSPVTLAAPGDAANPDGAGFANLRQDFGLFQPLSLGSFVWIDVNNNGDFDIGEPPLGNVPVTLLQGTTVVATTTTDANGSYDFPNLTPGSYQVSILPPTGVLPSGTSTPPLSSTDQQNVGTAGPNGTIVSPVVNLTFGGGPLVGGNTNSNAYVTFDFGLQALSKLSGFTYVDGNLDGVFTPGLNGDKAIPGVTVTLTGVDANGKALPTQTAITDKTGFYQFIDLLPGTYTVTETQPNFFFSAFDTPGPLGGISPGTNIIRPTVLSANQDSTQNNFGEFLPRMEFGYVWVDTNRNCTREIGELGLAGVPITIAGTAFAGTPFARPLVASDLPGGSLTVFTDATGYYTFPVLPPGVYNIARGDLLPSQRTLYANWCVQLGDPNPNPGTAGNQVFTGVPITTPIIRGPYNFGVIPINPNDPSKRNFLGSSANNPTSGANPNPAPPGGPTTGPVQYNPAFTTTTGNPAVSANVVVGTGIGQRSLVRVFDFGTGFERLRFEPYGDYTGSVRVAQGDVDGDGVADVITGTGSGGGPRVRVFSGKTGLQLKDFFAYEPEFRNGIFVAAGDVTGDGKAEIITGTDAGGGPRVTVFDAVTGARIQDFFAFDSSLRGGVRVAVGDFNADGKSDIVTTTGAGTATRVRIFNGQNPATPLQDYFAFGSTFTLGATLATGDVNGDGVKDVIVGTEAGGGPRVQVYDGVTQAVIKDFFAFDSGLRSGVRVAAQDIDGDGKADIVVTAGVTGAARTRILRATDLTALEDFFALHVDFRGGAYVG